MKPRKLNLKTIPARNIDRAYRFWRDVFDLPQSGHESQRHLTIDGQDIQFVVGEPTADIELLVRDHQDVLKAHLRNNFIQIVHSDTRFNHKIAFQIYDSEHNLITIEANQ
ncbi:lactoylglutathione lyase [Leuconostoc fallax]|nr:lactoylglutathione lyase [Leuconostoc fallax]MBU7455985.1 lactoylglutathione lyase [Leuconostoc fallax]MCO6184335.1 lactoylglutathione lyase [Leuconostoc fallax]